MKKILCVIAVAMIAAPAMADLSLSMVPTQLDASYANVRAPQGELRDIPYNPALEIYDNALTWGAGTTPRTAWLSSFAGYVPTGSWVADDLNMVGNAFSHVHLAYWNPGATFSATLAFWSQTASGGVGSNIAAFGYAGLGAGGNLYSLSFPTVVAPTNNIWMGIAFSGSVDHPLGGPPITGTTTSAVIAPGITTLPAGTSLGWTVGVPEPTTIALLAIGGLVALRRKN